MISPFFIPQKENVASVPANKQQIVGLFQPNTTAETLAPQSVSAINFPNAAETQTSFFEQPTCSKLGTSTPPDQTVIANLAIPSSVQTLAAIQNAALAVTLGKEPDLKTRHSPSSSTNTVCYYQPSITNPKSVVQITTG